MHLFHLGPAGDAFAGAFGIAAALLLIGGPTMLRWQRNRQQFNLMQSALAQGLKNFPKGPPFWLLSLRQGITALAIGVAICAAGGAGFWWTNAAAPPAVSAMQPANTAAPMQANPLPSMGSNAGPVARPGPPAPNPALEEWHRLKSINTLALMGIASGFVLAVLGLVRIAFSRVERRHFQEPSPAYDV